MHVVPDVLADLRPSIDLRVNFPEPPPKSVYLRTRIKRAYKPVEPGLHLLPEQVCLCQELNVFSGTNLLTLDT